MIIRLPKHMTCFRHCHVLKFVCVCVNPSFKVLCFEVLNTVPTLPKFINFQLEFLTQFDLFVVLIFGFF
jgi:hypothetical protein